MVLSILAQGLSFDLHFASEMAVRLFYFLILCFSGLLTMYGCGGAEPPGAPPPGALLHVLKGHSDCDHCGVVSVAVSPDASYVVTGSKDTTARIWSPSTGAKLHVLAGHSDRVSSVAVSPAGSYVVTGSSDDTARI